MKLIFARPFLLMLLSFVMVVCWASCNKDIPASSLPYQVRDFIRTYYPGKSILRVEFRDYSAGPYTGSSVSVSVPLNRYGSVVTLIDNSSNFNYSVWGYSNNHIFYGIYTVMLDGNIVLEFTSDGFFIRRTR